MPDEPPRELLAAAEAGDPEAQTDLGRFYANHGSADIAETWYQRAADQGLTTAKHNLGALAFNAGRTELAEKWFRAAALEGLPNSIAMLGAIAEGVRNLEHAARLYKIAAEKGHANAQDGLGRLMLHLGTAEGYEQARYWSERAAAQGVTSAEMRLGTIYHEGLGVARDHERAASHFLRAAKAGHEGTPTHDLLAAAQAGEPEAQTDLGRFYAEHGFAVMAETWFERAANQGVTRAKHNLGVLALNAGRRELAWKWLLSAADEGWVNSHVSLGVMAEQAGSKKQAAQIYEVAAKQGHAEAQDRLGHLMLELATPEGYEKARHWSECAAAQGLASADTRLATIYHEGLGVPRDPERAASLFLRAAKAGHPGARLMIGVAYEVGAGVKIDLLESAFWLSLIAGEDKKAAHYLNTRVVPELTEQEKIALAARLREAAAGS